MQNPHHLTVGHEPWCNWTGCHAGRQVMEKTGLVRCGYGAKASAERAASKLRPHFKRGTVKVVAGECSHAR